MPGAARERRMTVQEPLPVKVEVARLDRSRQADFHAVHEDSGEGGWCYCVAWWVETWSGWMERTAEQNRALRQELLDRGEEDGYLAYVSGAPVGWCQVVQRDRLTKLVSQYRRPPDPAVWAVTCFLILPDWRRKGVAARLLRGVIEDLRRRGVLLVEGYPRCGACLPDGEAWTGTESLFREAGFQHAERGPAGPIYRLALR